MSRAEAHALLDAARNGLRVDDYDITEALHATGDMIGWHPAIRIPPEPTCEPIVASATDAA